MGGCRWFAPYCYVSLFQIFGCTFAKDHYNNISYFPPSVRNVLLLTTSSILGQLKYCDWQNLKVLQSAMQYTA